MRWTINGDFASLKPTGVARYAERVVRALDGLAGDRHAALEGLSFELVVKRGAARVPALETIPVREAADLKPRLPQAWVQLVLPRTVARGLISLCNYGPLAVRRQILCIHDLHPLQSPQSYSRGFRTYNKVMLPRLGRRVAAVTTVSEFSGKQIVAHGVAPREKIIVTYNGHEHVYDEAVAALPARARPYVVGIGRDLAYKNTELMFAVAPQLAKAGIDIVLAGAFDPTRYIGAGAAPPANLTLAGRVSDAELFALMKGARAFLFPSRVEGFGLPAVEAMALDCPLIASNCPALPEVCGDAAIIVPPDDVAGWAKAAIHLTRNESDRERLVEHGRARRKTFSWPKIALQYVGAIRAIEGLPSGLPAAPH